MQSPNSIRLTPSVAGLRPSATSAALCDQILSDTGGATLPGSESSRPHSELTVRLSLVDFDGSRALAGVEGLPPDFELGESFVRTHCANAMRAVEQTADWYANAPWSPS